MAPDARGRTWDLLVDRLGPDVVAIDDTVVDRGFSGGHDVPPAIAAAAFECLLGR